MIAYLVLCIAGGVTMTGFFAPALVDISKTVRKSSFSLQGENVSLNLTDLPQQSRMYSSDGQLIAQFYTQNRIVVALKNISPWMQKAMVAREDHNFLTETGIDPKGIARAFVETFIKRGPREGGSTLTQQYVKNALIDEAMKENDPIAAYHARADTITRKLREMLIAQELNEHYNKAEILQGYLNIAQYGVNIYGVEVAAESYFGIHANQLDLSQSALIASITKDPAAYDPLYHPEVAQQQRNMVVKQMVQYGFATQAEASAAEAIPVKSMLHPKTYPIGCNDIGVMGYACDYTVRDILMDSQLGPTVESRRQLLYEGGLKIYTTFSETAEQAAYNAETKYISPKNPQGMIIAMASVQPGTGKIIEIQQNKIYNVDGNAGPQYTALDYSVDQAEGGGTGFGIGSSFKPINMVAWLQAGHKITQELDTYTVYPVNSIPCAQKTGAMWNLSNAEGGTLTPESPLHALIWSHNTPQASMAQIIGLCAIANAATELGYHNAATATSNIHDTITPTMIIGTLGTSPLTMANVYATIAANGVECTPIAIDKIINADGKSLPVPPAYCHQAISKEVANTVAFAMNLDITKGIADLEQIPGRKTFGKSGTNQDGSLADGAFVPQMATFTISAQPQHPSQLPECITGNSLVWSATSGYGTYCESQWYGEMYLIRSLEDYMSTYLTKAKIPVDDNYGTPDPNMVDLPLASYQWEDQGENLFGTHVAPMKPIDAWGQ